MTAPVIVKPPTSRRMTAAKRRRVKSVLMAPAKYSLVYLFSTFGIFLLSNLSGQVSNLFLLTLFITASYFGLYFGYTIGAQSSSTPTVSRKTTEYGNTQLEMLLICAGCAYFYVWGINQIYEFGGSSLSSVISAITSPGAAYKAKFEIYRERMLTNRVSLVTQILVLSSILYAVVVPLGITSWRRLGAPIRSLFFGAIAVYIVGFLFIGTMKGVGDIFLFTVAGVGVLLAKQAINSKIRINRWQVSLGIFVLVVSILIYMTNNQINRASEFGITQSPIIGDISDAFLTKAFGKDVAFGVYTVLAYPSHGYLGLSHNLKQAFEFSYGAGLSQAMESYRFQFLGGENHLYLTYPYRTQAATGWPAGMYWATIFPWLASDITFFLVPVLMMGLGFLFARIWIACVFGSSILALTALGQFIIFIAFIPANNQVLMQRQGFWVVVTLLAFWVANYGRSKRA